MERATQGYQRQRVVLPSGDAYWTVLAPSLDAVVDVDDFLRSLVLARGRAEGTSRQYASNLVPFVGWRASRRLGEVEALEHLVEFAVFLRNLRVRRAGSGQHERLTPARMDAVFTTLRGLIVHRERQGLLDGEVLRRIYEVGDWRELPGYLEARAYAKPVHRFERSKPGAPATVTRSEMELMLEQASCRRDFFLVVLLWSSGLRIGEALGLRRSDLHFVDDARVLGCEITGPHLHVQRRPRNENGAIAKGRGARHVPVTSGVLSSYARYREERDSVAAAARSDFVFVNLRGGTLGGALTPGRARRILARMAQRGGVRHRVTPHQFRHAMGTNVIESASDLDTAQMLLGHAHVETTRRYVQTSPRRLRAAVERVPVPGSGQAL